MSPFRKIGSHSPDSTSSSHPPSASKYILKPISAAFERLNNGRCTSATWKCMSSELAPPSAKTSQLFSPRFGMVCPDATSYSTLERDCADGRILIPWQMPLGITVSHALKSTMISMFSHLLTPIAFSGRFVYVSGAKYLDG